MTHAPAAICSPSERVSFDFGKGGSARVYQSSVYITFNCQIDCLRAGIFRLVLRETPGLFYAEHVASASKLSPRACSLCLIAWKKTCATSYPWT